MNKNIVIGVLVLVIAALLFFAIKCNPKKSTVVPVSNDSATYWKDKYGTTIASIRYYEGELSEKNSTIDSLAKALSIKPKHIKEVVTITLRGENTITTIEKPTIKYDTVSGLVASASQDFESPYYDVTAFISLNEDEQSNLRIQTFDTLTLVQRVVKTGSIFNRQTSIQFDIINANPYNLVTGIEAYKVELPKPKRFGIGLQVGYGFSQGLTPKPYIGIGASYNLIRF